MQEHPVAHHSPRAGTLPGGTGSEPAGGGPRRFGLSVGGIFLLLGVVSWWRGHVVAPRVLAGVGVLLVVPALVAPAILVPVERVWMRFAEALGFVNTRIILGVVFYVVLTPIGFIFRRFRDPLNRRLDDGAESHWIRRPSQPPDPARYRHQF